uniref:Uncharacterized protein n=1 Tax=Anguilla anguilla TaxID=7936 RepID=A0A0E9QZD5_ANGAN
MYRVRGFPVFKRFRQWRNRTKTPVKQLEMVRALVQNFRFLKF